MIIYIDMDGVISDFKKACELQALDKKQMHAPDKYLDFSQNPVIFGAKEAIKQLHEMGHDLYIASTPPWRQPKAWMDKRLWVDKHFPMLRRRVILTHHKNLLIGDVLIDDSGYRGQPDFKGKWIHFGSKGIGWKETLEIIKNIDNEMLQRTKLYPL
jgi:5'(3')-deoxyribonucleotidase